MKIRRRFVILVVCVFLAGCAGRVVTLETPNSISVPQGLDQEEIQEAIRDSMASLGWTTVDQDSQTINAELRLRDHLAQSDIHFDEERISIEYVASENLLYTERSGEERIHRNYNHWVENLLNEIRVRLNHAAAG